MEKKDSKLPEEPNNKEYEQQEPKRLNKVETSRKFQLVDSRLIVFINNQMQRTIPATVPSHSSTGDNVLHLDDKEPSASKFDVDNDDILELEINGHEENIDSDLFYEDKNCNFKFSEIPHYATKEFSTIEEIKKEVIDTGCLLTVNNDSSIICLGSSSETSDDESVIFVSEEKKEKELLVFKKQDLAMSSPSDLYPTITRLYNYHVLGIISDESMKSPEKKQSQRGNEEKKPSQVAGTPQANVKPVHNLPSPKITPLPAPLNNEVPKITSRKRKNMDSEQNLSQVAGSPKCNRKAPSTPQINAVSKTTSNQKKKMKKELNLSQVAGTPQSNKKDVKILHNQLKITAQAKQCNAVTCKSSREKKKNLRNRYSKMRRRIRRRLSWDNLLDQQSLSIQNRYETPFQTSENSQYYDNYEDIEPSQMNMYRPVPWIRVKRLIIIDGSNVAMGERQQCGRESYINFSVEGLKMCIDNFEFLGFHAKAVVPAYRMRRKKSSNWPLINELKLQGKIVCSPSKSHDQRVILDAAINLDAAVVSNDLFRGLSNENLHYREFIQHRLIRFMWIFNQIFITEDPYGRNGPTLEDILYRTEEAF